MPCVNDGEKMILPISRSFPNTNTKGVVFVTFVGGFQERHNSTGVKFMLYYHISKCPVCVQDELDFNTFIEVSGV